MRCAFCGLTLMFMLPTVTWTKEVLFETQSPQPFVYQIREDAETRSDPLSVSERLRHRYSTSLPLRNDEDWMTRQLSPGRSFCFQQHAEGSEQLDDAGTVQNVPPSRPSSVPHALSDVRVQDLTPARPELRLRKIKVLCLADESYRRRFPEWKERIGEIFARASRDFEVAFALRFTIAGCRAWDYEAKNVGDSQGQLARLVAIAPAPADLVIAFVGVIQTTNTHRSRHLHYEEVWGSPFGQHVMVSDIRKEQMFGAEQLLVRGLCHAFGAFYVVDRRSIMNGMLENVELGPIRFGSVTQQVILLTRDFDFRKGPASLEPEAVSKIRELYRRYRRVESKAGDDPVTEGYKARELHHPPVGSRTADILPLHGRPTSGVGFSAALIRQRLPA